MKTTIDFEQASREIAFYLRHRPQDAGICLDRFGWADSKALVGVLAERHPGFDDEDLAYIVETDPKGRYEFSRDGSRIRACYGHSVDIECDLSAATPPNVLYHGTADTSARSIEEYGISAMSRIYVHLSADKESAFSVGSRHGKPVVFAVDAKSMSEDGYEFYNVASVWLTKCVPAHYLLEMHSLEKLG